MMLIYISICWIAYFILHSLLAADTIKTIAYHKLGMSAQQYRLLYVIFALVGFVAIIVLMAFHDHSYIFKSSIARFFGLVLATYGIFVIREAFKHYHTRAFLGLADPQLESEKLITEGMQRYVRHPLYSGTIVLLLGFFIYMPSWVNLITICLNVAYILVGIRLEEQKLVATFGEAYEEYRHSVPMLIPRLSIFRF